MSDSKTSNTITILAEKQTELSRVVCERRPHDPFPYRVTEIKRKNFASEKEMLAYAQKKHDLKWKPSKEGK